MRALTRRVLVLACAVTGVAIGAQELPVIKPVGTSSYDAAAKYLNPGGTLYAYLSTGEWAAKLDRLVGTIEGLVVPSLSPEQSWRAETAFKIVHRFVAECGLADLVGIGLSSVQTGEGLYHGRVALLHGPGAGKGLYWEVFGGANGELDLLNALPANTALACWLPCDLKPLWGWIQGEVMESGSQPLADGFEQGLQRLQGQGIIADAWIGSLANHAALVLTVDPEGEYALPAGGPGRTITVPAFGVALLLEVRDDTIFKAIDAQLADNPQVVRTDSAALRQRVLPSALPPPLRATVAQMEGFLILATSEQLANHLATGGGGLRETALFRQLAANLPEQGTAFSFVSPAFGRALGQAVQASLANTAGEAAAAGLNSMLFGRLAERAGYWVAVNTPDAIVAMGNSNYDYGQDLVAQAAVAPLAILGGVLLPALSQARHRAREVSDMNNLKQLGLGLQMWADDNKGAFPDDLGALMEKGYITAGNVFVSPGAATPPPADAAQVRAGQCDYVYFGKGRTTANCSAKDALACTRPGLLGGQRVNVLYGDGHVQSFTALPADLREALAKAGMPIPAPGGAPAPALEITATAGLVEREEGYARVGGLTLGQALAAKHPTARVLILTGPLRPGAREDPLVSGLREGMQGMTVVATVPLTVPEQAMKEVAAEVPAGQQEGGMLPPLEFWFTGRVLNEVTAAYAGEIDLVVTTVGLPVEAQPEPWFWQANVKVAFANGSIYDLRRAIEDGRIIAALACNPRAIYDDLPLPADPGAAFAKRYLLLSPENVTQTAAEYPDLFRR